jgi:cytochrome c oxidase cbb3-type subunit 2
MRLLAAFSIIVGCQTGQKATPDPIHAKGVTAPPRRPAAPRASLPWAIEPAKTLPATPELVARGKATYVRQCAPCHGDTGKADGPAQYLLYPKPRDLTIGTYRFTSTWEGAPTDEDLFRAISRGIPGSAMPSWAHLEEEERWGLVHFVKTLAEGGIEVPPSMPPDAENAAVGEGVVSVPKEPPDDEASRARGRALFATTCAQCHGDRGQGDGKNADTLKDSLGYPIRPRDLTTGVFKGSPRKDLLFRRIVTGIPSTPMPAAPQLYGDDGWHVVHHVLSLSSPVLRERAEMKRELVRAVRVAEVPRHPDSGAWSESPGVELHLMPLWWRYTRPEIVEVRAVHDGKELAVRLVWADSTHDDMAMRPQDFRDAAAIQFSLDPDPPFFAMGEARRRVNIWMWKSERERELAMVRDVDIQYPNVGIDSYPNVERAPYEQPMRRALTRESDPTYVTAWGAGNIVADPMRKTPAEDLNAEGFGTLRARGKGDAVEAHGEFGTSSYRVVFRRTLTADGDGAVDLSPGASVPVAFAIWNGSAGDRDGKKSVTVWQDLVIEP